MATEMPAEMDAADERWQRMWSHREQLLKVARRRSMSQEDAEDAVHEAMLRAAERPDLDDERLGAWLTTVTMRLCVDRYRQVNREAEVHVSPTLIAPGPVPVEEAVCDRAEAKWLAVRSGELPARQAEALWLKSEDLDVGQVAVKMGLSYRTVESLLARARRTLRNSLAATLGFLLFLLGRGRLKAGGKAQAVAVASTAATLAVAGFVLPYALDGGGGTTTAPHPSVAPGAGALRTDSTGTSQARRSPAPSATSATPPAAGPPGDGTPVVPLSVPPLPEVSAPTVPKVPGVPSVPTVSGLPKVTNLPDLPTTPVESTVPPPPPTPPRGTVHLAADPHPEHGPVGPVAPPETAPQSRPNRSHRPARTGPAARPILHARPNGPVAPPETAPQSRPNRSHRPAGTGPAEPPDRSCERPRRPAPIRRTSAHIDPAGPPAPPRGAARTDPQRPHRPHPNRSHRPPDHSLGLP